MKNFNFFEKLWEHSRTLRRVGLVLVMCLITITQAWAGGVDATRTVFCNISQADNWYLDNDCTPHVQVHKSNGEEYIIENYGTVGENVYRFEIDNTATWIKFLRKSSGGTWNYTDPIWINADASNSQCCYKYHNYFDLNSSGGCPDANRSTFSSTGGLAYFYAGNLTETSNVALCLGRWDNTKVEAMSLISNTNKLYYTNQLSYDSHTYSAVVGTTAAWGSGNWGSSNLPTAADNTSPRYGWQFLNGSTYYLTKAGTDAGATLNIEYKADGYGTIPKCTTTVAIKVKEGGATVYSNGSSSDKPATTIQIQGTNLNGNGTSTREEQTATWSSSSSFDYASVISGAVTTSYSSLGSTWNFDGWYINDEQVGTGTSYDFYQHSNTTVEARFTKKYTITYYKGTGDVSGSAPSATTHLSGETVTVKDNTGLMTKSGKVFAGWATSSARATAGTIDYDPCGASKTFTISSDVTLYPVWKDGYYLITPGGTTFNLSPSTPFLTTRSIGSGEAVSVNGISSAYWWNVSSGSNVVGVTYDGSKQLVYDTQTDDEDIYVYAKGTGNLHYAIFKEGVAYTASASDTVAIGTEKVFHFSIKHSLKSRLVISLGSGPKIITVRVVKNGSALDAPCTAGYQLSFPGRAATTGSSKNGSIDGITLVSNSNLTFGTGNVFQPKTTGSHYAQFTTTGAVKLQVTTTDTDPFYVCTDKSSPSTTGVETGGSADTHSVDLSVAGTYYITPKSSNQVDITKIAFAAITSCTAPSALAASDATTNGITLTVTDESTQDYEFYVNTSSTPPTASSVATHSVDDSKSLTIDNLSSGTTYYAWARTKCDYFNKSSWVALTGGTFTTTDACSAPTSPTITGTTNYTAGENISLTASATGTDGSTTYTWYKGDNWATASAGSSIGSAATYTKASCVVGDAGTYWCNISNGDGCEVQVSKTITVSCNAVAAPTSLTCSAHTTTTLTFGWTKAANASGYTATLYPDEDCAETPVSSQNLGDVNSVTFTSLTPNETYYCKVQSKGDGSTYCADGSTTAAQSGTTDAPSAPTFSPTSGTTVSGSQSITITGHSGSTVYYAWATSAQSASDIYNNGSGSHGTADAGTASTTVQSGKTLYAISRLSGVNSSISSAFYTVDATAPTLSSSVPANSATGVNTSGTIVLTFSEALSSVDGLKFTLTNATKGAVAIDGSDNTKVNIAYSGASYSTTVTLATAAGAVTDAVGNTSAALSSISFTTKAEPTCSGDPSALANEKLYKVEDMASACADDLSESGQYKYGLSSNGKFYVVGTTNDNDGSTGTVEMKTDVSLSNVGGDADADFTSSAWLKMAGSTSHHSIKFVIPTGGGKLYVYGKGGGSKDGKGNVQIKENSTSIVTEVIAKTSSSACKSSAISVNAGTYYIYSSGESAALYGIYFDKAPELSSSDPANGDTDVPVSGTIVLTFDESIADVDDEKFTLSSGSISAVAVDGTYDTKVNITYSGLPGSTDITLSVAAGAVTDAAGNTSAALSNITFTTVATGYAITNADPDNGTIAITDGSSDITEAEQDATVYIAATPSTGYEFTSWDVYKTGTPATKVSTGSTASTSFTMPAYAVTVDATFTAIDYDITHSDAENGTYTISVAGGSATDENTTANYGQTITLAATPSSHYKLQAWNVTKTSSGDVVSMATANTFVMPAEAVAIAPTFGRVYTVTFRAYGGSSVSPIEQSTVGGAIEMPSTTTSNDSTFTGWMIGGTTVAAGASYTPTADVIAYATWQKNCAGGGGSTTIFAWTKGTSTSHISISSGGSESLTSDNRGTMSTGTSIIAKNSNAESKSLNHDENGYKLGANDIAIEIQGTSNFVAGDVVTITGRHASSGDATRFFVVTPPTITSITSGYDTSDTVWTNQTTSTSSDVEYSVTLKSAQAGSKIHIFRSPGQSMLVKAITVTRSGSACYHLTYDGNGADAGYVNDARAYSSGDNVWVSTNSSSSNFSREGYEFNGWNNKADGSGTYYNYWTNSDKVVITKDTTLYAQWKIVVDEDNENLSGFETPQYKDVVVRNGAKLTITQNMSVRNITVESGSTLHVAKNGEEGITLSIDSLSLVGGYYMKKDYSQVYDMPRVYIDPLSTLSRTNSTINFDFAVTNQYHPIAVPFPVKVSDVKYANESLRAITTYGTHYLIKTYDGAARANGSYACWTFVSNKKYNEDTEVYEDTYLQPGRGYILAAIRGKGDPYAFIRFPMKNVPSAWTTLGEQGTVDDVTKNVVAVEAYLKDGDADGSKTPNANKGWNILGVPFMSRYQATDDIIQSPTEIIQGHFDYSTNKWDDDEIRYVTVPTYDFSEYNQYSIEDEGTILLPGWCFFVQVETSGNLKFLSEAEAEAAKDQAMPIYAPRREQEHKPTVKTGIILTGANAKDKTTILVSDKYNAAEYEINADLEKMFGENGYTLATYTLSGETRLAYNAMNNADIMNVIPVGYRAPEEGEYIFSINPRYAESEAFEQVNLIDYEEGVITNLLQSSYSFTTARTQNDARFAINVVRRQDMPTDVENVQGGDAQNGKVRKVLINDKMYILLDGKMYDATGKSVK